MTPEELADLRARQGPPGWPGGEPGVQGPPAATCSDEVYAASMARCAAALSTSLAARQRRDDRNARLGVVGIFALAVVVLALMLLVGGSPWFALVPLAAALASYGFVKGLFSLLG